MNMDREVLTGAVQRQIFCQHCRKALDVDRAVFSWIENGPSACVCTDCWDAALDLMGGPPPGAEVIDGREAP